MIVYSTSYPGLILICSECGALLGYDPHQDFVEDNQYIYCPLCRAKNKINVYDGEWRPATEEKTYDAN